MNTTVQESLETTPAASNILLSVCIPTYNRAPLLTVHVTRAFSLLTRYFGNNFEILISDNHSTDDTKHLIEEKFRDIKNVRIVSPPKHYPTAEENLCFAIDMCRGEYIWTLGDDDALVPETLASLFSLLQKGEKDFMIFNSKIISYYGNIVKQISIPCLSPQLDIGLLEFIQETGFHFIIARFSTTIFRRSAVETKSFREILNISKIYSHVTWLISQFHDKAFAFINLPLVFYRENLYVSGPSDHWEKVAQRENLFVGSFWNISFLRQMDYLVDHGIIERRFLRTVINHGVQGRFRYYDELLSQMLRSITYKSTSDVPSVTKDDLKYFCSWLYEIDGENLFLILLFEELTRNLGEDQNINDQIINKIRYIFASNCNMKWYEVFWRYNAYGYAILCHNNRWFAILMGEFDNVDFLLQNIDFDDFENILFVRKSESELLTHLAKQTRMKFKNEAIKNNAPPHDLLPSASASPLFVIKPLPVRVISVYRQEGTKGILKRIFIRLSNLCS